MPRDQPLIVCMPRTFKTPQSVLVVIHTAALDVLLIRRADADNFWQSVTGSKDDPEESWRDTAIREVFEETGINCGSGTPLEHALIDWRLENVYDIYPQWLHRYAAGITRNTEHLLGLTVAAGAAVRLHAREHTAYQWMPWRAAAESCFSPSNAEAILMLPRFVVRETTP